MAKRKLSHQQRESVRREIKQSLDQKKKTADILRGVAEKYGITTITARWYLKSIRPGKASPGRKVRGKRHADHAGTPPTNGASLRLVQQVQSLAEKSFKRVLEVKKLIPKWQVYVKKEASLRQAESRLQIQLRDVRSKAAALHRRIQALSER